MTKLVAVDMDGTLLNNRKELPKEFIPWVKSHPDITVAIASGRQYFTLLEMFHEIKDQLLFIAENGSVVFHHDRILYQNTMKKEHVLAILESCRRNPKLYPVLCGLKSAYISSEDPEFNGQVDLYYARTTHLMRLEDATEQDEILKLALYVKGNRAEEEFDALPELSDEILPVLSGKSWIDVANATVNKGEAVQRVQESLGITKDETMAFGDYLNDLAMMEASGDSWAMQNSHPDLIKAAKYLAPPNEKTGVMKVLESLIDNRDTW